MRIKQPSRARVLRAVMDELARGGTTDLWSYLIAFHHACSILGERLPGPLGPRGYRVRVMGMCLAAAAASDFPEERQT